VRGAFTGAVRDHDGFFSRAHGGTLFLDEIGDTPAELQPMLLRVLETGELQRVGGTRRERVDVRVVAATDQDLDAMLGAGFRAPLFHRLSGYTIALPPLRDRRDDIARLFVAFAAAELTTTGDAEQLAPRTEVEPPYITTELATRLVLHGWPGNVRELRNVTRQIVIASRGSDVLALPEFTRPKATPAAALPVVSVPAAPAEAVVPVRPAPPAFRPSQMDDDALIAALEAHAWKPGPTAEALGISRTTLYAMIERSPRIRKARDVPEDELLRQLAGAGGDLDLVAERLHVSKRGLQLRLKEIGGTPRR
jgi:two-component system nitrogen regulation response regulator GlnG